MPNTFAQPFAFDLTPAQHELLLGLVMRAADADAARYRRMVERPVGSHAPAAIQAAHALVVDMRALEAAVKQAPITEPE